MLADAMISSTGIAVICLAGYVAQQPDLETVLSRAGDYVQAYERTLGMVIAREEYVQRVPSGGPTNIPSAPGIAGNFRTPYRIADHERRLHSDYMMIRLPDEDQWVGFRAVVEVDGRPVRDRLERLQDVLTGSVSETVELWRRLSAESARYNIGGVNRNTNVPTFALLVVRPDHQDRFEFEHTGNDRIESLDVWVISYRERSSPTLIANLQQEDVFSHGRMWVDPSDGRVVRTEVKTGDKTSALRSEVTVRYQPNVELDMWVPRDMKEHYQAGDSKIDADARYSDYQRFNVSVDTTIAK